MALAEAFLWRWVVYSSSKVYWIFLVDEGLMVDPDGENTTKGVVLPRLSQVLLNTDFLIPCQVEEVVEGAWQSSLNPLTIEILVLLTAQVGHVVFLNQ